MSRQEKHVVIHCEIRLVYAVRMISDMLLCVFKMFFYGKLKVES